MILRELIARVGVEVDPSSLMQMGQLMRHAADVQTRTWQKAGRDIGKALSDVLSPKSTLMREVAGIGATIAGALAVNSIRNFTFAMSDAGEELHNASQAVGLSAQNLYEWRFVADQSGVSAESLTGALSAFSRQIGAASLGNKGAAQNFTKLGVNIRDTNGHVRDTNELLEEVGFALAAMPEGAERTAAAMRLLGRSGAALIPVFSGGRDALASVRQAVRDLTGNDLQTYIDKSEELNETMDMFKLGLEAIKISVFLNLAPAVEWLITKLSGMFRTFQELTRNTEGLKFGLYALTGVLLAFNAQVILAALPVLAVAAAIAFWVLALEDLNSWLSGGNSLIGEMIDNMFGLGTASRVATELHNAWVPVRDILEQIATVVDVVVASFSQLTSGSIGVSEAAGNIMSTLQAPLESLGRIFGTGITSHLTNAAGITEAGTVGKSRAGSQQYTVPTSILRPGFTQPDAKTQFNMQTHAVINVTGAENPEETARTVQERLREREGAQMRDAQRALTSRGR